MPRIKFENTRYDLGEIKPNSKNTAIFKFKNAGDATLQITDVKRCCGAVIELDKYELGPGQSGILTWQYYVHGQPRILEEKVTVSTNDPEKPQVVLSIKGIIIQTLMWDPTHLKLFLNKQNANCPDITIKSLDGTVFSIKGFRATGDCITADFDPNCEANELVLKPRIDITKLVSLVIPKGRVRIDLDREDYNTIYLNFDVLPIFAVIPPQIFIVGGEPNKTVVRNVRVLCNYADLDEETDFLIESVTAKSSRIEVRRVHRVKRGYELNLQFCLSAPKLGEYYFDDQLLIKMKGGEELRVPVRILYASGMPLNTEESTYR